MARLDSFKVRHIDTLDLKRSVDPVPGDSVHFLVYATQFRLANRHFITTGQKLCKLMREELGDGCRQEPGETIPFPSTWSELHHLTTAELDMSSSALYSLEQLNGVSFSGKSIDERRGAFEEFLPI